MNQMSYIMCVIVMMAQLSTMSALKIQQHKLFGKLTLIAHDLDPSTMGLHGNKHRKFDALINSQQLYPVLYSCGGVQSNSMLALSTISKTKNCNFVYFIKPIPQLLIENPQGNFKKSLENGMKVNV